MDHDRVRGLLGTGGGYPRRLSGGDRRLRAATGEARSGSPVDQTEIVQ